MSNEADWAPITLNENLKNKPTSLNDCKHFDTANVTDGIYVNENKIAIKSHAIRMEWEDSFYFEWDSWRMTYK